MLITSTPEVPTRTPACGGSALCLVEMASSRRLNAYGLVRKWRKEFLMF